MLAPAPKPVGTRQLARHGTRPVQREYRIARARPERPTPRSRVSAGGRRAASPPPASALRPCRMVLMSDGIVFKLPSRMANEDWGMAGTEATAATAAAL